MADVRELTATADLETASHLFAEVWRPTDPMTAEMMRVIGHIGGYVAGAFDGATMVGATVGLPTADGELHSHITGVTARGTGVGFALKRHQRAWALHRDISVITWTFDPLVRRNAYFNLAKLAARAERYAEDFYGEMPDELNAGDPSDRLHVAWRLTDPAVERAMAGGVLVPAEPCVAYLREAGPRIGPSAAREIAAGRHRSIGIGTPDDIAALRADDPGLAAAWRRAQREAFVTALAAGYHIAGCTGDGRYVLETGGTS